MPYKKCFRKKGRKIELRKSDKKWRDERNIWHSLKVQIKSLFTDSRWFKFPSEGYQSVFQSLSLHVCLIMSMENKALQAYVSLWKEACQSKALKSFNLLLLLTFALFQESLSLIPNLMQYRIENSRALIVIIKWWL